MKKASIILSAILGLYGLPGCGSQPSGNNSHKTDSVAHATALSPFSSSQLAGYFADTIPCADCAGIVTRLQLNKDSSFILEQEYVGAKDPAASVFYQLGSWTVVDSILRLAETTEGPRQFKIVAPGELKILDNEGSIITGTKLNYSLHRQQTAFTPKKNIPVRGMFVYYADAALLRICALGKDLPLYFTPATKSMETAYSALKKANQERVMAEVEGRFENKPSADGNKTEETFVVEKFIRFLPGEKCKE